jgi:hypothetical protein
MPQMQSLHTVKRSPNRENPRVKGDNSLKKTPKTRSPKRILPSNLPAGCPRNTDWEGTKRQEDESDEEDDKSIDQIEERIKKLEKDLEQRIGKHTKAKPSQQSANEKLKPVGAPPLPKKDLSSFKKPEDKPLTTNHPQSKSKLQSAF